MTTGTAGKRPRRCSRAGNGAPVVAACSAGETGWMAGGSPRSRCSPARRAAKGAAGGRGAAPGCPPSGKGMRRAYASPRARWSA